MDIVRGEFESLGYISSRERGRAEYLTRAKSPVGAEIAITVAAGSRVVLDRCGIRRIKRGPASCHNRQSKHRGSRSAISNLCFASALITYGNGHPVDPCTHTRTRSLHPRVARVSIVGLPVWFTVLERDDTSATSGLHAFFPRIMGGKKKEESMSFTIVARICEFSRLSFHVSNVSSSVSSISSGFFDRFLHSLHRTGRN